MWFVLVKPVKCIFAPDYAALHSMNLFNNPVEASVKKSCVIPIFVVQITAADTCQH